MNVAFFAFLVSAWNVDDDIELRRYRSAISLGRDVLKLSDRCYQRLLDFGSNLSIHQPRIRHVSVLIDRDLDRQILLEARWKVRCRDRGNDSRGLDSQLVVAD